MVDGGRGGGGGGGGSDIKIHGWRMKKTARGVRAGVRKDAVRGRERKAKYMRG